MNFENALLGLPDQEVKAAMIEEDCAHCFGCPHATVVAAQLASNASRSQQAMEWVFALGGSSEGIDAWSDKNEQDMEANRTELAVLTGNCKGYSGRVPGDKPSEMCQSPSNPDRRIAVVAGKFLDLIRLRVKPRV